MTVITSFREIILPKFFFWDKGDLRSNNGANLSFVTVDSLLILKPKMSWGSHLKIHHSQKKVL